MVGDGGGLDIVLTFDAPRVVTAVGVINGYAKTDSVTGDDRYAQERRTTGVTWSFDDGTTAAQHLSAHTRNMQGLTLPQAKQTRTVTLHLDSVTGYTKPFDYTAISEIEVDGN